MFVCHFIWIPKDNHSFTPPFALAAYPRRPPSRGRTITSHPFQEVPRIAACSQAWSTGGSIPHQHHDSPADNLDAGRSPLAYTLTHIDSLLTLLLFHQDAIEYCQVGSNTPSTVFQVLNILLEYEQRSRLMQTKCVPPTWPPYCKSLAHQSRSLLLSSSSLIITGSKGSKFYNPQASSSKSLGGGIEVYQGFFHSVRPSLAGPALNLDTAYSAFVRGGPLVRGECPTSPLSPLLSSDLGPPFSQPWKLYWAKASPLSVVRMCKTSQRSSETPRSDSLLEGRSSCRASLLRVPAT